MLLENYVSLYEKDAATRYYQKIGKELPKELERKSAYEKLIKYKNRAKVYFSFRSIEKIGINPKSEWSTPNGIYTYPLKEIIKDNPYGYSIKDGVIKVPFAGDKPYIYVVEAKGRGIKNLFLYTEQDLQSDVLKLKNGLKKYNKSKFAKFISNPKAVTDFILTYAIDDFQTSVNLQNEFMRNATDILRIIDLLVEWSKKYAKNKTDGGRFWYITKALSSILGSSLNSPNIWSFILNKILKYNYIGDFGYGIIHNNEPFQTVFFNTSSFDVLEIIENKSPTESVEENEYVRQGSLVWDYEFSKMSYSEALEYVKSKRGNWRLPSFAELELARKDNVKGFVKPRRPNSQPYNYYFSSTLNNVASDLVHTYDVGAGDRRLMSIFSNDKHFVRLVRDVKVRQIKKLSGNPTMYTSWVSDKTEISSSDMQYHNDVRLIYVTFKPKQNIGVKDIDYSFLKVLESLYPKYRIPTVDDFRLAYKSINENDNLQLKNIFEKDMYWCLASDVKNKAIEKIKPEDLFIFSFNSGTSEMGSVGEVSKIALIKK